MSVIDKVRQWFSGGSSQPQAVVDLDAPQWWRTAHTSTTPASGVTVNQRTAETYSAVWAATRAICENLASLPPVVWRNLDVARRERERARDLDVYRILHDQPNPNMDSFLFYEVMTKRLVNSGRAFAFIERDQVNAVRGLWPIHPDLVEIRFLGSGPLPPPAERRQIAIEAPEEIAYVLHWRNREWTIMAENMLHLVGPMSPDGLLGPGVIPRAAESIGLGLAVERYGAGFFGRGAQPAGVLTHPGVITDPETRENIRREWNAIHQGTGNAGKVAVLWEGMAYAQVGVDNEQAQFLASRQWNSKVIAQWYGLAPAVIQDYQDSKFQTADAQIRHFILLGLRPWAVRWERAVNRQVMGADSDLVFEFLMDGLLRGDPKTQAEVNSRRFERGAINQDEWRAQDNLPPLPRGLGQIHYVPRNLMPVTEAVAAAAGAGRTTNRIDQATAAAEADIARQIQWSLDRGRKVAEAKATRPETWNAAITDWYDAHEAVLADRLTGPIATWLALTGRLEYPAEALAAHVAHQHCERARGDLLAAAECQPDQLPASVASACAAWSGAPFSIHEFFNQRSTSDEIMAT